MNKVLILKIAVSIGFVTMVFVNYLANALPIGGVSTGEASDAYPNLFTPAGITFSIWGLIYLLLLLHISYQWGIGRKDRGPAKEELFVAINPYFLVNTLANIAWIFAWHYGVIWLSALIMLLLLFTLIRIADIVNRPGADVDAPRVRAPFGIYFGWISVATIANITVLLVSLSWDGFGIAEQIWTVIVLLVGASIGIWRAQKDKNVFYAAVFVWAYAGILLKHVSETGYAAKYPGVIVTLIFCLVLFGALITAVLWKIKTSKNDSKSLI